MIGYILTHSGETWQLPPLLRWNIERTDGDPCDSAEIAFLYEPPRLETLKGAVRLRLTDEGQTVFFGVVDELSFSVGAEGRRAELSARSLAALMMDTELRAATYSVLTAKDAVRLFAAPCGVTVAELPELPPVRNFYVETGTTCWQAFCGFFRHSADLRPRFRADGTLLLRSEGTPRLLDETSGFTALTYRFRRYGVIAEQLTVSGGGAAESAKSEAFAALGGTAKRVTLRQGKKTHADWRTAEQRVADAARDAILLTVTLPGGFCAEPNDPITVNLPSAGVRGTFTVRALRDTCKRSSRTCTLELEGSL